MVTHARDGDQISVSQAIDDLRYFDNIEKPNPYYTKDFRSEYVKNNEKSLTGDNSRPKKPIKSKIQK